MTPAPRVHALARALALCFARGLAPFVLVLGSAACGSSPTVTDEPDPVAPVELQVTVPVPDFAALEAEAARFVVRSAGGATLADTTIAVAPASPANGAARAAPKSEFGSPWTAAESTPQLFTVRIPGEAEGTRVVLTVTILDGEGEVLYEGIEQAIESLGSETAAQIQEVFYVGPGAEAAAVSVLVEGTFFQVGDVHLVSATVTDGGGAVLSDVPVLWAIDVPSFVIVEAYYNAGQALVNVMANSASQPAIVTAALPNGIQASAELRVEVPYPRAVSIDVPELQGVEMDLDLVAPALLELDTVIALPHPPEMSLYAFWDRVQVPTIRPQASDDFGTVFYDAVTSHIVEDGTRTVIPMTYVGPGSQAASVEITPAGPLTVYPGTTLTLEGAAYDAGEQLIVRTPVQWAVDSGMELVSVETNGDLTTTAEIRVPEAEGDYRIIASSPNGVADTLDVTVDPIDGVGADVTFDQGTFPEGSSWVDGVVVREQYAALGVHFDFVPSRIYNDLQGGPTLAVEMGTTNGFLTVDYIGTQTIREGKALGSIVTRLDAPVPEVRMTFWSPTGDVEFTARDGEGNEIAAQIVKSGVGDPWEHREVVITAPSGIFEVWATVANAAFYLDNIRY